MDQQTLYVTYSADDNYAKYLGASMLTLLEHNRDFARIVVFALDCGMQEESREKLRHIAAQYQREIRFIPMQDAVNSLDLHLGAHKIAVASYARLFLANVLPEECDRVLYLDCDTIVLDSLREMWNTPLGDSLIAGVQDTVDSYFLDVIGLEKTIPYFNAGILLIHLKRWREENLFSRFEEIIRRFDGNVPHHDQGTINATCAARRTLLPVRYNLTANLYSFPSSTVKQIYFLDSFYSQEEIDAAIAHPAIVHFTTGLLGRPWEENSRHPQRDAYAAAMAATPWGEQPLLPDSRYFGLKAFTFVYEHCPRRVFEACYRRLCFLLHLRK